MGNIQIKKCCKSHHSGDDSNEEDDGLNEWFLDHDVDHLNERMPSDWFSDHDFTHKDDYDLIVENGGNMLQSKISLNQWDSVENIIQESPELLTEFDVISACRKDPPLKLFRLMLGRYPDALLEDPRIISQRIIDKTEGNKQRVPAPVGIMGNIFQLMTVDGEDRCVPSNFEYFQIILELCPAATAVEDEDLHLTLLLMMFQQRSTMTAKWIGSILDINPDAARAKDYDGKTPLHLAYQHGASTKVISMLLKAYPEAINERDNLGRTPNDLANQKKNLAFTPYKMALMLTDNTASYPKNGVVVCHGDVLMKDIALEQDKGVQFHYSEQVLTRHSIFETLLDEFSKLVGIDDKDVIQKAATVQALASKHLSRQDDTIINLGMFHNPGYWYQQEVLKLVMRVYHEGQSQVFDITPPILDDAWLCLDHLNKRNARGLAPKPSKGHIKAFEDLTAWLTYGLNNDSYSVQGPVLKPLQSLFNKLYIRRGQTTVHVIGDTVRGTLGVKDKVRFRQIVSKIENAFPNITEDQFQHPDTFDGLVDFLNYVHDSLKFVPDSNRTILPYRFKQNSSQKKKEEPLWYNFNFFYQIPEYHRVGHCQMFVACELQIGISEEINSHRVSHVAYERNRILSSQPILKNYEEWKIMMENKKEGGDLPTKGGKDAENPNGTNCSDDDVKLINAVLLGKVATQVLGVDRCSDICLEGGPFFVSEDQINDGSFMKPSRLCLNHRCLNWHVLEGAIVYQYAMIVAGPFSLDEATATHITKRRYFVDSFAMYGIRSFFGIIGLYAHVGPYLIQVACGHIKHDAYEKDETNIYSDGEDEEAKAVDLTIVESGRNFSFLEQICPLPEGTTAVEVIAHGRFPTNSRFFEKVNFQYKKMKLSIKVFESQWSNIKDNKSKKHPPGEENKVTDKGVVENKIKS